MVKKHSCILIAALCALVFPLTAASASTRPQWQTVFHSSAVHSLSGLAIDQRGRSANKWMYTADASTGYLLRLGTGGHYLGRWSYGPKPTNPYVLTPAGVAVGGQGNVFVTDAARNRIDKFYPPYGLINHWGTAGSGPNQFNMPVGIAVDRQGYIYVADKLNLRIQQFSPAGTFLSMWPMPWRDGQGSSMPTSVAIGPGNTIYVAGTCYGTSCTAGHADSQDIVVKFSTGGHVLQEWVGGTPHGGVGPDEKPWIILNAMTVDGMGTWYVTGLMSFPGDSLYPGVLQFSPAGTLLHRWRVPDAATPQGIGLPQGIALDPRGAIYVTQGAQILKLVR
jgi:DNA-binding beta-propeller fold protein YncE